MQCMSTDSPCIRYIYPPPERWRRQNRCISARRNSLANARLLLLWKARTRAPAAAVRKQVRRKPPLRRFASRCAEREEKPNWRALKHGEHRILQRSPNGREQPGEVSEFFTKGNCRKPRRRRAPSWRPRSRSCAKARWKTFGCVLASLRAGLPRYAWQGHLGRPIRPREPEPWRRYGKQTPTTPQARRNAARWNLDCSPVKPQATIPAVDPRHHRTARSTWHS